jgi:hypothetical protein
VSPAQLLKLTLFQQNHLTLMAPESRSLVGYIGAAFETHRRDASQDEDEWLHRKPSRHPPRDTIAGASMFDSMFVKHEGYQIWEAARRPRQNPRVRKAAWSSNAKVALEDKGAIRKSSTTLERHVRVHCQAQCEGPRAK